MKPRRMAPIAFGVFLGIVAVILMSQFLGQQRRVLLQQQKKLAALYQNPVKIFVAAKDIPAGAPIAKEQLAQAEIPEKFVEPYATQNAGQLIGRVAIAPIAAGEQLLTNKVRSADQAPAGTTLSSVLPKGKRAVTIGIDAMTGVGGFVRPGDSVDILWSFKLPGGAGQESQLVTVTLFQNVPVLAAGRDLAGHGGGSSGAEAAPTVTLALPPQEASFLLFAREQGRIQLSLRPNKEPEGVVAVAPANINTLLESQLGVRTTQPTPKESQQVEVYKGLKRDVVVVSH